MTTNESLVDAALAVADRERDRVGAVVRIQVRRRGIGGRGAVAEVPQVAQRIAVRVRSGAAEGHGRAFVHGLIGTGIDQRSVIDRRDRQRHGGDVAVEAAVVGLVGEAVAAVVVGVGRVGEGAVGVQSQRAVGRAADEHRAQRIAVHIAVVAEHAGSGDR